MYTNVVLDFCEFVKILGIPFHEKCYSTITIIDCYANIRIDNYTYTSSSTLA